MQKKLFLICDSEENFSVAFAAYLSKKKDLSFAVHACHSPEQMKELSKDQEIGILLLGSNFPKGKRKLMTADWIFCLSDSDLDPADSGEDIFIYKYQSAEAILADIFRHMGTVAAKQTLFVRGKRSKSFRVIGFYSPIHRVGQTENALQLGQEIAISDATLYLSLELYGGEAMDYSADDPTIEDVIYYSRQENQNLGILLTTMVKQKGQLDYILPARVSENIRQVSSLEWQELFERIAKESVYDVLILDLDSGLSRPYEILKLCSEIHVLHTEDETAKKKIAQFEEELRVLGYEDIRKKLKKKVMP